jgi:hypothetical protein
MTYIQVQFNGNDGKDAFKTSFENAGDARIGAIKRDARASRDGIHCVTIRGDMSSKQAEVAQEYRP